MLKILGNIDTKKIKRFLHGYKWWPIHVFFFSSWFVLVSYSHNKDDLTPNVILNPLFFVLTIAALLLIVLSAICRDIKKAAIISTATIFMLFGYGYIADIINKTPIHSLAQAKYILTLFLLILGWLSYRLLKNKDSEPIKKTTLALNSAGLFLVVFNLIPLLSSDNLTNSSSGESEIKFDSAKISDRNNLPDVYYIVPEDYAGNSIMKDYFKLDNSEFTDFLKNEGFTVFDNAIPNYPYSPPSLASTLHMRYLDEETAKYGAQTTSVVPYYQLMENNKVVPAFKSIGYKYVHVGSWWGPTSKSSLADYSFTPPTRYIFFNKSYVPTEFERSLFNSGVGRILLKHPIKIKDLTVFKSESTSSDNRAQTFINQVDYIKQSVVGIKDPKFVFMHIMTPHRPFVFDKNCSIIKEENPALKDKQYIDTRYRPAYVDQAICTNRQLKTIIQNIKKNSARPPIIVLQSDEGEFPSEFWYEKLDDKTYDWMKAPENLLDIKFKTISAFYAPQLDKSKITEDALFVNTFRFLFKEVYGANIDLLEQKNYISNHDAQPFVFKDVTEILKNN